MDVDTSVIARIKKLLNLAESSNEHEAALAASKAQELAFQHNLELSTVQGFDLSPDEKVDRHNFDLGVGKAVANWKSWLFVTVTKTSLCHGYLEPSTKTTYGRIIGRKADVEVAQYTYSWLLSELERLSQRYMADQIFYDQYDSRKMRRSWLEGASQGVCATLNAEFRERESQSNESTALVVVRDREINTWMEDNGLKLRSKQVSHARRDSAAFSAGFQTGSNLSVRRGIGGGSTPRIGR
jgi:hypothetical protein